MKEVEDAMMQTIRIKSQAESKLIELNTQLEKSLSAKSKEYQTTLKRKVLELLKTGKTFVAFLTHDIFASWCWFCNFKELFADPKFEVSLEKVKFTAGVPRDMPAIKTFMVTARDEIVQFLKENLHIFSEYPCVWNPRFYKNFTYTYFCVKDILDHMIVSIEDATKFDTSEVKYFYSSAIFFRLKCP